MTICDNCRLKSRKMTDKRTGEKYYTCGGDGSTWNPMNHTYEKDVLANICPHERFCPIDPNGQLEERPRPDGFVVIKTCLECKHHRPSGLRTRSKCLKYNYFVNRPECSQCKSHEPKEKKE